MGVCQSDESSSREANYVRKKNDAPENQEVPTHKNDAPNAIEAKKEPTKEPTLLEKNVQQNNEVECQEASQTRSDRAAKSNAREDFLNESPAHSSISRSRSEFSSKANSNLSSPRVSKLRSPRGSKLGSIKKLFSSMMNIEKNKDAVEGKTTFERLGLIDIEVEQADVPDEPCAYFIILEDGLDKDTEPVTAPDEPCAYFVVIDEVNENADEAQDDDQWFKVPNEPLGHIVYNSKAAIRKRAREKYETRIRRSLSSPLAFEL